MAIMCQTNSYYAANLRSCGPKRAGGTVEEKQRIDKVANWVIQNVYNFLQNAKKRKKDFLLEKKNLFQSSASKF